MSHRQWHVLANSNPSTRQYKLLEFIICNIFGQNTIRLFRTVFRRQVSRFIDFFSLYYQSYKWHKLIFIEIKPRHWFWRSLNIPRTRHTSRKKYKNNLYMHMIYCNWRKLKYLMINYAWKIIRWPEISYFRTLMIH